jgi:hypothetical protein
VLSVRFGIQTAAMRRETDMDSNVTIRPRPGVASRSNALRDPVAVREAIDTELDASKSVAALGDGGTRHGQSGSHQEPRDFVIDPQAQAVLFSAVDVRAEPTEQSPNQALMAQRAYQRQPAPKETPSSPADPHADIEA